MHLDLHITEYNRLVPEHFMLATIYAFKSLNCKAPRSVIDNKIAELYGISDEEREIEIRSETNKQTRFKGICSSARTYLLSGGALKKEGKGSNTIWEITEFGRNIDDLDTLKEMVVAYDRNKKSAK